MEASEELRKLRESTGMNRKEFCEYFEIPYMTETDWELGNRRVPKYLLRLMEYKVRIEQLAEKNGKENADDQKIDGAGVDLLECSEAGVKMYISQSEALKLLNPNMYRELLLVDGIVDFSCDSYLTKI